MNKRLKKTLLILGSILLSGSFIVSGECIARVEHIGGENYISVISSEAKYKKKVNSMFY